MRNFKKQGNEEGENPETDLDALYMSLENEKRGRRGTAVEDLERLHTELVTSKRLENGNKYTVDHESGRVNAN